MYTYRIVEDAEEKELIYKLRYDIYCEEKRWLDSSEYSKCLEKDKYDETSLHFGAFDINNILVGSVRLIFPESNMKIPIEESFQIASDFNQKRLEVSRLVIPKDKRGYNISMGLIRTIFEWAIKNGMTHAYSIIENDFMVYINRKGYPFKPIKEGKDYFGGYTIPTCLILNDVEDYFVKNKVIK
ncbi:N-acyl amino acid synthase FeeM domain-containing protein [Clostridium lacusfryxellense]|uniref:N-acyl amino acid synthase FeeM domain-containing protein n=1 Tax=Clostridium lacusfryxellense TaxID=205328 RepID=UPI001C0C1296|nr:GNAT family N-acyltransferase [Clostridium lacusfryxellense]MBU3111212.1 GNAT family N-acetyltransferase [Clostridium lacusfryxellense]